MKGLVIRPLDHKDCNGCVWILYRQPGHGFDLSSFPFRRVEEYNR